MQPKSLSRVRGLITTLLLACTLMSTCAFGEPQLPEFTYQGRLSQNSLPANGNFDLSFALFDAESAGTQVGATINEVDFPFSDGMFSVSLAFPGAFNGTQLWLQVSVDGIPLLPRQAVTAAPVAQYSLSGSITGPAGGDLSGSYPNPSLATGAVTSSKVGSGAITASKLASDSVTSSAIAAGAVDTSELALDSVTRSRIADNSVSREKIYGANVTGTMGGVTLGGGNCGDAVVVASGAAIGDMVFFSLQDGETLPSKFIAQPMRVDTTNEVVLRFCNIGSTTQSFSSLGVHILTMRP